jgi:hypothetical protein
MDVRGREKVPTGGQDQVPAGGQLKSPLLAYLVQSEWPCAVTVSVPARHRIVRAGDLY